MSSKRLYFGLLGLIGLLFISLIAGVYEANGLLATRADSLTSLKAKSQALAQEQQSLNDAKKDIKKYASLEQIAKTVVPEDKDQAEAVREIVNIAGNNGVTLGSITFPTSTLGNTTGSAGSTSTTTTNTAPAPAVAPSPNSPQTKLSQLLAVKGIPGVYQLTITIVGDSSHPVQYSQMINFLSGLEHDRRTAQVNSINLEPDSTNPKDLHFTLTLNEYIKP